MKRCWTTTRKYSPITQLIDDKAADIRKLEAELEQARLKKSKDLEDLLDKNTALDKDNLFLTEKVKGYRKDILELEDLLEKAKKDKSLNEQYMETEIADLRKKLDDLQERLKINNEAAEAAEDTHKRELAKLEKDIEDCKEQLAQSYQRENDIMNGVDSGPDSKFKGMVILPEEKVAEFEKAKKKLGDNKSLIEKLSGEVRDKDASIKELTGQLNILGEKIEEKNLENKRLRDELEVRVVYESKDFKKAKKLKVDNDGLKQEVADRDKKIKELQAHIELLEAKLIKMTKMMDKMRFENQKISQTNRLNQLYSSKIQSGYQPMNSQGRTHLPANSRDLSPDPIQYPVSGVSYADSFQRGYLDSFSGLAKDELAGPSHRTTAVEPSEKVQTFCFVKANAEDYLSPYIMRQETRLLVAGPTKTAGKYERVSSGVFANQRPYNFRRIFTQFELEQMTQELVHLYDADKTMLVIYGSPLNIKLFVILKALLAFFVKVATDVSEEQGFSLEFIAQKKFAKLLEEGLKESSRSAGSGVSSSPFDKESEVTLLKVSSSVGMLLEASKKIFYDVLTQASASSFTFITINLRLGAKSEPAKTITIVRSQVQKLGPARSFKDSLEEVLSNYQASDPATEKYLVTANWEQFNKAFILVLEPGKVNTYEESLELLDVHSHLDKYRLPPRSYDNR